MKIIIPYQGTLATTVDPLLVLGHMTQTQTHSEVQTHLMELD